MFITIIAAIIIIPITCSATLNSKGNTSATHNLCRSQLFLSRNGIVVNAMPNPITVGISFYSTYTLHPGDIFHMKLVCLSLFILIFGGILASLLVLLYLSLERYLCIVHPHFHKRIKVRHVVACSIFAYGLGIAFTTLI
jgi:hypothetical protein